MVDRMLTHSGQRHSGQWQKHVLLLLLVVRAKPWNALFLVITTSLCVITISERSEASLLLRSLPLLLLLSWKQKSIEAFELFSYRYLK